jgi:hypothetical protein
VMLWLFPILSRINCALAANASTSLDIPISKQPSRLPLSHLSVLQWHSATNTTILSLSLSTLEKDQTTFLRYRMRARSLARPPCLLRLQNSASPLFVPVQLFPQKQKKKRHCESLPVALITELLLQEIDDRPVVIRARLEGAGQF